MQKNDFVRIEYSGRIKETGQEFDKGNVPIAVGAGFVIKGIDEALINMNVNEKKTIEIPPEKAFGVRDQKFIKLVPLSEFKKNDTMPYPGMIISADGIQGRVLSVNSGRVRVDFNHPLAGKTLIYDIEVKEKIEDVQEKAKALVEFFARVPKEKIDVKVSEKELEITVPPMVSPLMKKKIADFARSILGFERTKFSELYEKGK